MSKNLKIYVIKWAFYGKNLIKIATNFNILVAILIYLFFFILNKIYDIINNINYGNIKILEVAMNIVIININGIEYKLKGDESTEYLNDIAGEIDGKIREMLNSNRNFSSQSAAVLLSINYCDQLRKLNFEHRELKNNIEKSNIKVKALTNENIEINNKIVHIENENKELELKNRKLEEEIEAYDTLIKEEKENIFCENNEMKELEKEIEMLRIALKNANEENAKLKNKLEAKNSIKQC